MRREQTPGCEVKGFAVYIPEDRVVSTSEIHNDFKRILDECGLADTGLTELDVEIRTIRRPSEVNWKSLDAESFDVAEVLAMGEAFSHDKQAISDLLYGLADVAENAVVSYRRGASIESYQKLTSELSQTSSLVANLLKEGSERESRSLLDRIMGRNKQLDFDPKATLVVRQAALYAARAFIQAGVEPGQMVYLVASTALNDEHRSMTTDARAILDGPARRWAKGLADIPLPPKDGLTVEAIVKAVQGRSTLDPLYGIRVEMVKTQVERIREMGGDAALGVFATKMRELFVETKAHGESALKRIDRCIRHSEILESAR